jgi:hypothetical protein
LHFKYCAAKGFWMTAVILRKIGPQNHGHRRPPKLAKKKKVIRRALSKEDVRTLKTMARERKGVTKIAKALKRTPGATTVMAAKRGV